MIIIYGDRIAVLAGAVAWHHSVLGVGCLLRQVPLVGAIDVVGFVRAGRLHVLVPDVGLSSVAELWAPAATV